MRVIITGASGFIGKNLLLGLPSNWEVIAVYNQSTDFLDFLEQHKISNVTAVKVDLLNKQEIDNIIQKHGKQFDVCVYLAANGDPAFSVNNPIYDIESNTISLINFLDLLEINRLVYFSSGAVYDGLKGVVNPQSKIEPKLPYAISKLASELYVKFFRKENRIGNYIILRFFGAYGPYEPNRKIYNKLVRNFAMENNNTFIVRGDGKNMIDAMYIDDTIAGIKKVVSSDNSDITVDYVSGNPLSINQLVYRAATLFGKNSPEIIHEGNVPEYINFRANIEEFNIFFQFKPAIGLEEGLMKFYYHLKNG